MGLAAVVVLAVSYLPGVYGPVLALSPHFHAATFGVMAAAAAVAVATALDARRGPSVSYVKIPARWNALIVFGFCLSVSGVILYMITGVWTSAHISHWDNYYCNTTIFPAHRATCVANMTRFTSGFRDFARAVLYGTLAQAFALEAGKGWLF